MYLTIYPNPIDSNCVLHHDAGWIVKGVIGSDANGRECQTFNVPDTTNMWGCILQITHPDKVTFNNRGLLAYDSINSRWLFYLDDVTLADPVIVEVPAPPTPVPTPPHADTPIGVINSVYHTGLYDLSTHDGCGQFLEACVTALHDEMSKNYGHLRKTGSQNQYNGHAVDALQLLVRDGETKAGVYDIILSSESPDAKPAFNYVGEPRPDLWYYPA